MRIHKKLLALALALCLGLGVIPMTAAAHEHFVIENNVPHDHHKPGGDGVLTAYHGPGGDVVIPQGVIKISSQVFAGRADITSVTIPDSVDWIGGYAFAGCTGLTSVTIPGSVYTVYNGAFQDCTGLTDVTFAEGDALFGDINSAAFYGCENLTRVTLPARVIFSEWAFEGCDKLTIYGVGGSDAAVYAKEYGIPFFETTAHASTQTVEVDGKAVEFPCYALRDANGFDTNYIKLRDLALLLNGTAAQFEVDWEGSVAIATQTAYTPNGSELSTPFSGDRPFQVVTSATTVDGQAADLAAFVLNDDAGGGYTYYQLRDLGKALGFNVGWAAGRGVFLETGRAYDPDN